MPTLIPVNDTEENQQIFLAVLRELLPLLSRLDNERLIRKIGLEKFKDACDELFGYIETGVDAPLTKLQKNALASKIIRCLHDYMNRINVPFTPKTVFDCFSLIQVATNEAFPGYHSSKLLKYTIGYDQPTKTV